jgi:hypothetical protein
VSWQPEDDNHWDTEDEPPRSRIKLAALIVAAWLGVSVVVLVGLLTFHPKSEAPNRAQAVSAPNPVLPPSSTVPDGWVQQASDDQIDCAAHAYGEVQSFLAETGCSAVHRVLATTNQGGRPVVVASSVVTFKSETAAEQYLALVTSDGTGNVSDLLRDGNGFTGGPKSLPEAAFAARRDGTRVPVAEAAFTDGNSDSKNSNLKLLAEQALTVG